MAAPSTAIRLATTTGSPTTLKIQMALKPAAALATSLGTRRFGRKVRIHVLVADATSTTKSRCVLTSIPACWSGGRDSNSRSPGPKPEAKAYRIRLDLSARPLKQRKSLNSVATGVADPTSTANRGSRPRRRCCIPPYDLGVELPVPASCASPALTALLADPRLGTASMRTAAHQPLSPGVAVVMRWKEATRHPNPSIARLRRAGCCSRLHRQRREGIRRRPPPCT